MNTQEKEIAFELFTKEMRTTLLKKANDYSNENTHSNFELAGAICGITPEINCLSLIATKVARLGVLLHNEEPKNESIDDTILDLANYSFLLHTIVSKRNKITKYEY